MTAERKRTTILVALVAIVGGLVVLDRLSADDTAIDSATTSTRVQYAQQATLVAEMRQFINAADDWERAQQDAIEAWQTARSRLIAAPTAELANAQLTRRINSIVDDLGVTLVATSAPSVRTPVENQPVRVIGLQITIAVESTEELFAMVDRLENMPDAWCHVSRVQVIGPRRTPVTKLDVDIDLEALALITTGGAESAT